jgi:hypothetical protein
MAMNRRRTIKIILALIGTAMCMVAGFFHWQSPSACGMLDFVRIVLVLLGLTGSIAVILSEIKSSSVWGIVILVICGGLIALMFIGLMSIGPVVFVAVLFFLGASLLNRQKRKPKVITSLGILFASSLLFFSVLYALVTNIGFEIVKVPEESFVHRAFSKIDYADAFRVKIPKSSSRRFDIVSVTRLFLTSLFPCWWNDSKKDELRFSTFEPGKFLGHWRVFHKSSNEVVVGFDRSFIDFRVSIFLNEKNRKQWVTVATVVRYNNWKGIVYFIPVRFGHRIIFADIMRQMKESFKEKIGE